MRRLIVIIWVAISGVLGGGCAAQSTLWGKSGEIWMPGQPLRDFSTAGYRQSNVPLPTGLPTINARDYGALGDGVTDDTAALQRAIAACPENHKLLLPAGTYVVTDVLRINKPMAIGGESTDRTTLYFPKGLADLYPRLSKTTTGIPTSAWSWGGGLVEIGNTHDAGIEDLTFRFPEVQYAGHFKERGSNGINILRSRDAWAARLKFYNADSGIFVDRSRNMTIREVEFFSFPGRTESTAPFNNGHHAIDFIYGSTACLADRITYHTKFYHEMGIEHYANGNVYSRCTGENMVMDHHQATPYGNLWTQIDLGRGDFAWVNNVRGSTMGEVYWNVRAAKPLKYPDPKLKNIVIGMTGHGDAVQNSAGPWVENIDPAKLSPANLFRAQLEKRIGKTAADSVLDPDATTPKEQ